MHDDDAPLVSRNRFGWRGTAVGVAVMAFAGGFVSAAVAASEAGPPTSPASPAVVERIELAGPVLAPPAEILVRTESVEEAVEPNAIERENARLPEGERRAASVGKPGRLLATYSVTLINGVEVGRVPITRVVIAEPVDGIVEVGTLVVPERPAVAEGSNRAIGQDLAAAYGWTGAQWRCLDVLWERESNWRHLAANPSSGAYGIPQALPGSKMASFGADWKTNPATQIAWGLNYIDDRYGSPCEAWGAFSDRSPHWY